MLNEQQCMPAHTISIHIVAVPQSPRVPVKRSKKSISEVVISIIQSRRQNPSHHIAFQNILKPRSLLSFLKRICLQSQCLGSELSERTLNPPLGLGILLDRTARTQRSRQQSSLAANEQATKAEECVGCNVAKG